MKKVLILVSAVMLFSLAAFADTFYVGERVVTDTHNAGTVVAAYSNDTVDIRFDTGGTNNWPISRVAEIQTEIGGFYVGEQVVTDTHYSGKISAVYSNDTADITFDTGGNNNWPTSRLGFAQSCSGPACSN